LQPAAAAVVASAPPCELAVRSALHRARSIAAQLEGRSLPRSGANAPPRRVRYFPTDRLRLLFGCEAFSRGYNCTEGRVPPDVCPHGAPPLLIHSTFAAHAAWPALRCLRLTPNLDQLTGSAADKSRVARTAAEGRSWGEREAAMVWVGTVKLPQRELFYSRRWIANETDRAASRAWLRTPKRMDLATAARDHKYLLDIGGNSGTTWTALAWKLASGALVFKAKSAEGATDLWHEQITPGVHLLEVEADFSDLHAQVRWAEQHPHEAERIALAGQALAARNENTTAYLERFSELLRQSVVMI